MQFTWDPEKAKRNKAKHGVSFELAQRVWKDPHVLIAFDRSEGGEDRWHAIGTVEGVKVLLVVHTYRLSMGEEIVRMIGARTATRSERRRYERQIS